MSDLDAPWFKDDDEARKHLEAIRWPNGPVCPHCGGVDRIKLMAGKSHRPGLHKCYDCDGHFTVTVGTVFEGSKIGLHKWFLAVFFLCSSKKGMSSHQLHRTLGVTYKTAWFMTHRIREAMREGTLAPMGGGGSVVEADETFIGRKEGRSKRRGYAHKHAVLSLVERDGNARSFHVQGTSTKDVLPVLQNNIRRETRIMTDEAGQYAHLNKHFAGHDFVSHGKEEYVRGTVHTNTIEGFFSIFKRGMKGIYQHCGEPHLHRYLSEFDFRYNHRQMTDWERTTVALKGIEGRRLYYKTGVAH